MGNEAVSVAVGIKEYGATEVTSSSVEGKKVLSIQPFEKNAAIASIANSTDFTKRCILPLSVKQWGLMNQLFIFYEMNH